MVTPSLEQARAFAAQGYKTCPISCEIFADIKTPVETLRVLLGKSNHCFLLESVEDAEKWGRYTFLGFDPKLEVTCLDGDMHLRGAQNEDFHTEDPGAVLQKLIESHRSPRIPGLPPFTGGLVGYFAYDFIQYGEPRLRREDDGGDQEHFNDVDVMLFDKLIAFDNFRQKLIFLVNIPLEGDVEAAYREGVEALRALVDLVRHGQPAPSDPGRRTTPWKRLFTEEQYCAMVERAKQYIYDGDIFQVVLGDRMEAGYTGSLLDMYRVLRTQNPSPYMFFFSSDNLEIAGASPETLVKLENGVLHTYPLAGSRPRGATPDEDERLARDLRQDPKELSEHNMLVDLGRNDLGRVSKFGTVRVEQYLNVLRFSHIMHLGSTVTGEMRDDCTAVDAVTSVLPAGTLSGAPKVRACEIIRELEACKRGIYGGAIGYLDFAGNLDTCIAIRIAYKRGGKVFVRAGAGIVADSVPEREFQECKNKARAVIEAIDQAQEGIDRDFID